MGLRAHFDKHEDYADRLLQEIDALRSVLSEWDEDKCHFNQWIVAEELRRKREKIGD